MNKYCLVLLIEILCSISIYAQRGISIQASGKKVEIDEPFEIQYTVSNLNEKAMMKPNFEPFILAGGPSRSSSMNTSIINGRMSSSTSNSYTFALVARKLGKQIVPKIIFQLSDNTLVESGTIEIEVVKKGSLPRQAIQQQQPDPFDPFGMFSQDPFDPFGGPPQQQSQAPPQQNGVYSDASKIDLKRDIFARIHVNKSKVYVGEQVNASIKIYTSVNSKGFEAEKLPNFNGFWSQDIKLPERLEMKREVINGKEFVSVEIKKILLFPTKAGILEITPLKMKTIALVPVSVKRQPNSRQPRSLLEAIQQMMDAQMGGGGGIEYKEMPYSFSSGSEKITVMELPPYPPKSFTGGVGKFTMNALCDKKELKTDEAINYNLEIQGQGNLPLLQAPALNWNEDFEVYDPQVKENYNTSGYFSGTKTWNYVSIPHSPGKYSTPKVEFSYFDLVKKAYVTLETPITPLSISGNATKMKEKGKKYSKFNYANQKLKDAPVYKDVSTLEKNIFIALSLIPFALGTILGFIPKFETKQERFTSGKKTSKRVTLQMKQAKSYLDAGNKEGFYEELTKAYWEYLSHKLKIETSLLSRANITEKLGDKNVSMETITKIIQLIDQSEMGYYTSFGKEAMSEIYEKSLDVLDNVEKQLS